MKYLEQLREYINSVNSIYLLLGLVIAISAYFYTEFILISSLFIITIAVSWVVKVMDIKSAGLETATFGTVVIAANTTPLNGAVAGFLLIFGQMIARQQMGPYIIWVIPSYAVAGAAVAALNPSNIFQIGLATTVGLHAVFTFFTLISSMGRVSKYLPYAVMNIGFNLILFKFIATPVVQALA